MAMSPQKFRTIRMKLGFSPVEMAAHLHMPNPAVSGRNSINRLERGHLKCGIPGPIEVAMEALESGFRATCVTCDKVADKATLRACSKVNCPFKKRAA